MVEISPRNREIDFTVLETVLGFIDDPRFPTLFSDRVLAAIPLMAAGQRIVRDTELPLLRLVGKTTKTFMVQGDLRTDGKRQSMRVKVGEVGKLQTREARAKAKRILGAITDGIDPRPKPPVATIVAAPSSDPTLRYGWTTYRDSHMRRKGRSEGTIASYTDHFERLLKDWLDEPLSKFGNNPGLLKQRHDQMTIDNGPYIANGAMRSFRAIYNHAAKQLGDCPRRTRCSPWTGTRSGDATLVWALPTSPAGGRSCRRSTIPSGANFICFCCCREAAPIRSNARGSSTSICSSEFYMFQSRKAARIGHSTFHSRAK